MSMQKYKAFCSKNGIHTYFLFVKEPEILDAISWLVGVVGGMSWLASCSLTCCRSVGLARSFLVVGRSAAQLSSCQAASGCQAASHVLQNHVNLSLSFPHTRATISTELNVHINVTDWLSTLIKLLQSPVRLLYTWSFIIILKNFSRKVQSWRTWLKVKALWWAMKQREGIKG
jgi:hypothetical protein